MSYILCKIPRIITKEHLEYMRLEASRVPDERLDELIEASDGEPNEWQAYIDQESWMDTSVRYDDALAALEARGGRGVTEAEAVDALGAELESLRNDGKRKYLEDKLLDALVYFIDPVFDPMEDEPFETCRIDPFRESGWSLLITPVMSGDAERLAFLDYSHITRVRPSEYRADEMATKFEESNPEGALDDALDDLVFDCASDTGSDVNSGGLREQICYLIEAGVREDVIERALEDAAGDYAETTTSDPGVRE